MRARKSLKVEWDTEPASSDDSEQITEAAKRQRTDDQAKTISSAGDALSTARCDVTDEGLL